MKGCYIKNAFTFSNVIYEQIDGVSMGSPLGLFKNGLLKFLIRYVDCTLALIKESDIDNILSKLTSFHPSLNFTFDDDGGVHYLDWKVIDNETDIYYK